MNWKAKLGLGILLSLFAGLFLYNVFTTKEFFQTNIGYFLTITVAVFVTFFLTQSKNDDRNRKDLLFGVVDQIQDFVFKVKRIDYECAPDFKDMLLLTRRISSKTYILGLYADNYNYRTESQEINDYVKKYIDLVDYHQQDMSYMQKTSQEIARWMENIDSRCDIVRTKLYPPK